MDKRKSLMSQIDALATELGQEKGYASNATIKQLEARLDELEAFLPDEEQPTDTPVAAGLEDDHADDTDAEDSLSDEASNDDEPEKAVSGPAKARAEAVNASASMRQTCRVKARCRYKGKVCGQTRWVSAHEIVTMTVEEAAAAVADGVATKER